MESEAHRLHKDIEGNAHEEGEHLAEFLALHVEATPHNARQEPHRTQREELSAESTQGAPTLRVDGLARVGQAPDEPRAFQRDPVERSVVLVGVESARKMELVLTCRRLHLCGRQLSHMPFILVELAVPKGGIDSVPAEPAEEVLVAPRIATRQDMEHTSVRPEEARHLLPGRLQVEDVLEDVMGKEEIELLAEEPWVCNLVELRAVDSPSGVVNRGRTNITPDDPPPRERLPQDLGEDAAPTPEVSTAPCVGRLSSRSTSKTRCRFSCGHPSM